jgi:hypothetical protein
MRRAEARLEGFEPPLTQIRSLRLCPLSYRRGWRFDWRAGAWKGEAEGKQPIPLTSKPESETKLGYLSAPSPSRRNQAPARRHIRRRQDWIRARW